MHDTDVMSHCRSPETAVSIIFSIQASKALSYTQIRRIHLKMFPHNIVGKWIENLDIEVETISVGRSFMKHHTKYKDTY